MTPKFIQYSDEMLETWRTGRLSCLYLNCYLVSRESPEDGSQLERVAQILSQRPLNEKRGLQSNIKRELNAAYRSGNSEQTALYDGMLKHYIEKVMMR